IYTIDSSRVTGGTNFNNFRDAAQALINCGITGPVMFNVLPGKYESMVLEEIPGASNANTVTFSGTGAGTIITSALPQTPAVYFDGADHVVFRKVTVTNTSASSASWGIFLKNSADSN